jgi:hypothetical protein
MAQVLLSHPWLVYAMKGNQMSTLKSLATVAVVACLGMAMGCEREVAHEREVDVRRDGTVHIDETRVTEQPDGAIRVDEHEEIRTPR